MKLLLLACAIAMAHAQQGPPPAPLFGAGFDETLAAPSVLARVLARPRAGTWTHPLHIRLIVNRAELEPEPGRFEFGALEARLAQYRALADVDVYLDIRELAVPPALVPDWTRFLRALATRVGASVRGYVIGVSARFSSRTNETAFFIKSTAVELRATDRDASVTLGGVLDTDEAWLTELYNQDVGPYIDAVGLVADSEVDRIAALVDRRDPGTALVVLGARLEGEGAGAARQFAARHLALLGTRVSGSTYAGSAAAFEAALPVVTFLRDLIDQQTATIDDATVALSLKPAEPAATAPVRHRLIFGLSSAASYLVYFSDNRPLDLSMTDAAGSRPVVRDPAALARVPVSSFAFDAAAKHVSMRLPPSGWPLVVDWSAGDATTRVERAGVTGTTLPSLAEIIARHQQAQAAQDAAITSFIVDAKIAHHFRANAADSSWDVETQNRYFVQGRNVEFEERSFHLNGTRWGPDRPPFPLLQAEKVLSLPLDLRLTSDYHYRFEGVDTIDGRECFVLRFDPAREDQSLFRGTVWIDRQTYLKLKVHTIQTQLGVPILSSEETQRFAQAGSVGDLGISLLAELTGQQNIMIAGASILLERHIEFRDFQLNPADFEAQREAARAGANIMYRDTDRGLRYLVKENGQRVVEEDTTKRAKALLLGVNFDPSYDFPLPLGGLSYLDFEFLGPNSQMAMIFGGVLAIINVQRPQLVGKQVDGSVDLFAIAVPGSDRTYDESGERIGERVLTIPFSTGANVGWRVSERLRLTAHYQFRFDWYGSDTTTAPEFVVPSTTVTNGVGLGLEWRRSGYAFSAGWIGYARAQWEPWGDGSEYDPSHRRYTYHSASISKDFFTGLHKFHLNAAYYGGNRLDRFSEYQFGFFGSHRIRGVPASGVRFGELGMVRASYSWNLFDQYRLELALDHAYGRDRRVSSEWQQITGVGVGFLLRGPFKTMIRGDVGKSFLPERYQRPGSLVFQIQILKPL